MSRASRNLRDVPIAGQAKQSWDGRSPGVRAGHARATRPGRYRGVFLNQHALAVTPDIAPTTKSLEERKALLAQALNGQVVQGSRVETQSDYQAVLVKGKPVNHVLHLILSVLTFWMIGGWLWVWAGIALFGGEKRYTIQVDEYGNTNIQR